MSNSQHEEKESSLTDDPEIAAQRWCLLSFISPENVLARKDPFFFASFLKQYEFQLRSKGLEQFLVKTIQTINGKLEAEAVNLEKLDLSGAALACRNSTLRMETFLTDFHGYVKGNLKEMSASKLQEEYDDYMYKNSAQLEDDFFAKNNFRTTVRGLKIRGAYSTKEEAEMRAKKLQKMDADHNIFVGQVGKWLPWDPKPSDIADQEYAEEELNTLMKKYKENEEAREVHHKERRDEARRQKNVVSMPSQPSAAATEEVPSLGTGASEFSGMFSGPADLAIQRKMEKE
jgi:Family of unknown function (DUF5832)